MVGPQYENLCRHSNKKYNKETKRNDSRFGEGQERLYVTCLIYV